MLVCDANQRALTSCAGRSLEPPACLVEPWNALNVALSTARHRSNCCSHLKEYVTPWRMHPSGRVTVARHMVRREQLH